VVTGRRSIGKTTLLREFCKGKDTIFFSAKEESRKLSLESFSKTLNEHIGYACSSGTFESFEALFDEIYRIYKNKKMIVVIDEFPYVANADKSLMSTLQHLIDHKFKTTDMFIIICGSSISFMDKKVLAYKAPLYGRRTGQIRLKANSFKDSIKYIPNFSNEHKVIAYSIVGGTPKYLQLLNDNKSIKQNLLSNFIDPFGNLHEEPITVLKQELREPKLYNSIIEAIATGYTKINEISTKIGEEKDKTSKYIGQLVELDIVSKETPVTEDQKSKKTIYSLNDDMFKFWYRFVYKNLGSIGVISQDVLYQETIEPYLNDYAGNTFESICKEHMLALNKTTHLPFPFLKIGRWWGSNPKTRSEVEIDFIAFNNNKAYFVECKWRNQKTGVRELSDLITKSELFNQFTERFYVLYSKSGFNEELTTLANNEPAVMLYDLDDIINA
jgi:AAA+ ATPase superfamily predicted ATPase